MRPNERVTELTYWDAAPAARDAHPREEHLLPLHVAVGAAGNDPGRRMLKDIVMGAVELELFSSAERAAAPVLPLVFLMATKATTDRADGPTERGAACIGPVEALFRS